MPCSKTGQRQKALATISTGTALFDRIYKLSFKPVQHLPKDPKTKTTALKPGDQLITSLRNETKVRPELAATFLYQAADLQMTLGRPSETMKIYKEIGEPFGLNDGLRTRMTTWYLSREKRDEARKIYGEFDDQIAGPTNLATMAVEESQIKKPSRFPGSSLKSTETTPLTTSGPSPDVTRANPTEKKTSTVTARLPPSPPTPSPLQNAIANPANKRRSLFSTTKSRSSKSQLPKQPFKSVSLTKKPGKRRKPTGPSS